MIMVITESAVRTPNRDLVISSHKPRDCHSQSYVVVCGHNNLSDSPNIQACYSILQRVLINDFETC